MINVSIQAEDFDVAKAYAEIRGVASGVGAIVTFTGLVRDFTDGSLKSLDIEHYPQMANKSLQSIAGKAAEKWPLKAVTLIHRFGHLAVSDQIVFVGVASGHRDAAFHAANFIMDTLKTQTPFWKKETTAVGSSWVEMKDSDRENANKWLDNDA